VTARSNDPHKKWTRLILPHKFVEKRIRDSEHLPEAHNGVAIVAAMNRVDVATNWIRDLHSAIHVSSATSSTFAADVEKP
jgi:hypothetical protein